jgi:sugar phosphate permease
MRGTAIGTFFSIASAISSFAASFAGYFAGYIAQVFGLHRAFFALSVIVTIQICFLFCLFKIKNNRK